MAEVAGTSIKLYVNTGSYTAFAYAEGVTLNITGTEANWNNKSTEWDRNLKVGVGWNASFNGIMDAGGAAEELVIANALALTQTGIQIKTLNSKILSGTANITSYSFTAINREVCKFSCTLNGDGALTYS